MGDQIKIELFSNPPILRSTRNLDEASTFKPYPIPFVGVTKRLFTALVLPPTRLFFKIRQAEALLANLRQKAGLAEAGCQPVLNKGAWQEGTNRGDVFVLSMTSFPVIASNELGQKRAINWPHWMFRRAY